MVANAFNRDSIFIGVLAITSALKKDFHFILH